VWLPAIVVCYLGFYFIDRGTAGGIPGGVLAVIGFVIAIATQIKRWHDRDKSGSWIVIALVPLIGGLWALIETGFLAGTLGDNKYGSPSSGSPFQ
jgi:uncharacterized membrane protein YhaH (DUF805 family)